MKLSHRAYFVILLIFFSKHACASEIDSFSLRHMPLTDSLIPLNLVTNNFMDFAVDRANQRDKKKELSCNQDNFYKAMRGQIAAPLISEVQSYVKANPKIFDQHTISIEQSIYKNFLIINLISYLPIDSLEPEIQVGGVRIGIDKIGHFHTEGWEYFKRAYLQKKGVNHAMSWGDFTESNYFGAGTTGVYSFGDLVANFEGMRFWIHLLGNFNDPLSDEVSSHIFKGPYYECVDGRWEKRRDFSWADYVNDAWDEAINCSRFRSIHKLAGAVKNLSNADDQGIHCLLELENSEPLLNRYDAYSSRLLNFEGHAYETQFNPIKFITSMFMEL